MEERIEEFKRIILVHGVIKIIYKAIIGKIQLYEK
jgi:hypothetical protein